ncbi:FecR domain-containing protein [Paraflavitalea sp. CAU 1676]|uniref:FecR domain-containing protein n=1 Tax=Paraflavitalea sp. CAU 1676 TaxID=3032598 RepID=UPI0023DBD2AE|nr:FecR domain-containing protein [Paraflavitalea sp. CAU 1676]MDF2192123.1 FecR domain-containing protein [Paraflavitalea sp. CAU 1676]
MNSNDHIMFTELITKYLCGDATPAEALALDDWLADPENARQFRQIRQLWDQLPGNAAPPVPDAQQAWEALNAQLPPAGKPARLLTLRYRWLAAAAILLLLLPLWWFLKPSPVQPPANSIAYTATTGAGEIKPVTIPDGTAITLHHNSTITYSTGFNQLDRAVQLRGEAYFDVTHNTQLPFTISIADLTIQVVGTSFNVRDITPSGNIEVQVLSGMVKMFTSTQAIMVPKDHTGIYDVQKRSLYLAGTIDVNSVSYATKSFQFNDLTVQEACQYLEKAFNIQFQFDQPSLAGCRLSARFDNRTLPYILNILNATLNTNSRRQGNLITLSGKGCE